MMMMTTTPTMAELKAQAKKLKEMREARREGVAKERGYVEKLVKEFCQGLGTRTVSTTEVIEYLERQLVSKEARARIVEMAVAGRFAGYATQGEPEPYPIYGREGWRRRWTWHSFKEEN